MSGFFRRSQPPESDDSALDTRNSPLFDDAFRRRLELLAIRTRQTLAWRAVGEHRSPRQSPSREFIDFRSYSQGEDLRYLDWNTFARLGEMVSRAVRTTLAGSSSGRRSSRTATSS